MKQSQIGKTIERNRPLNDFTHRKLGSIFGSSDNLAGLDEYYSSPPGNSTSSSLAKSPTPLPKPRTSSFSSTSETETLQELLYDAGSLLIFGSKDGNLQVNKIFHSSRVLQFITSVNVCPAAIAEPTGTFQSMSGLASGEITHLVMQSHHITEHSITLPIFAAFKGDNSSILHQFSVAVLRKKAVKSNLWKARNITEASLRSFVNLALSLRKAHYRWLPSTDSTEGSITNHTQHMAKLPPSLASPAVSGKAFLISACAQPGTDLIFTTLHLNLSSQCVILQPSATLNPTRVNPLFPVPTNLAEPLIPSPSGLRGHDADNPADAGLFTPASPSSPNRRLHEARVGMTCVHDFPCGGIAWGRSVRGGSMGAFLYTPASSVDNGVGVGMFEVRF